MVPCSHFSVTGLCMKHMAKWLAVVLAEPGLLATSTHKSCEVVDYLALPWPAADQQGVYLLVPVWGVIQGGLLRGEHGRLTGQETGISTGDRGDQLDIWGWVMGWLELDMWRHVDQEQVSRAGASNYIPQKLWDVITCPCPWYLLLAPKSLFGDEWWDGLIIGGVRCGSGFWYWCGIVW